MFFKKLITNIKKYFCFKTSELKKEKTKEEIYIPKIKQFKK